MQIDRLIEERQVFAHPARALTDADAVGGWVADEGPPPSQRRLTLERLCLVLGAMSEMRRRPLRALVLHACEDRTFVDIGETLGVSGSRARQLVANGERNLRRLVRKRMRLHDDKEMI